MTVSNSTTTDTSEEHILPNLYHRAGICILVILLVFGLATLGRVPEIPSGDDGGYAAAAYQFWKTGHPGVPGYRDILGLDRDMLVFGRIAAAVQGVFMHIFGVSVFAGFLPSFLTGIGVLFVTYSLGKVLWGSGCGLLAVIILAVSGIFFNASHSARPDMLLALCFLTALYLFASAPPHKWSWRYSAAGLVIGLSGDVHLNGFLLAPIPLLFWLALRRESPFLRLKVTIGFGGAGLIGVILWFALHYWPDAEAFRHQFTTIVGGKGQGIRVVNLDLMGAIQTEIGRYLSWFWNARLHRHLFEGLAIAGSGAWMLLFGKREERALVLAWFLFFVVAVLFIRNGFGFYLIYVWPIFALWISRALMAAYQTRHRRLAVGVFTIILFAGYVVNHALITWKSFSGPSYSGISRELRSVIPGHARVVAGGEWWFSLYDRDFTDAQHVQFLTLAARAEGSGSGPHGWEVAWRRQHWDYAIALGDYQAMFDAALPIEEACKTMYPSRKDEIHEARSFALRHARLLSRIETAIGPLLVLRIQ